jgi:hypothetical protein
MKTRTNTRMDFTPELGWVGLEIPEHTQQSIQNYLLRGYNPGGFVTAILANDLDRAVSVADTVNRQMFWAIARWVQTRCPDSARGSYEAVEAWCRDQDGCRTRYREEYERHQVWLHLVEKT